ncbi:MAG TPA: hypothetical protein VFU46_13970 [Gemmatimonadales bacterium]|nr:hypothetical protein [Gemmatimonadales bacterium]
MQHQLQAGTVVREGRPVCRAAAVSFAVGLVALRVCWLPGVNCVLALAAIGLGAVAAWQILHSHGRLCGVDEAVSGVVLGVVVLGLSVFFISAIVAAWRH